MFYTTTYEVCFISLQTDCPDVPDTHITSWTSSGSCTSGHMCLGEADTVDITLYHMFLLTGVRIETGGELDLTVTVLTPRGTWRKVYSYDSQLFYPEPNSSFPSVSNYLIPIHDLIY